MAHASSEPPPAQADEHDQPAHPEPRPEGRAGASLRDMIGAIVVLLVMVGAVVGLTRACTFSPDGPTVDPNSAPTVDATRELRVAAASTDFAVRLPVVPQSWRANSASTSAVGSGTGAAVAVRVGWLTTQGRFVQLSQSSAEPADLVATETGRPAQSASGEIDVAGTRWRHYPGRRDELAWVTTVDGVSLLITGTGDEAEFRVLAAAVLAAEPLPRG